jgi:uncharacterized protein involved in outer membrane biogenesis
VIRRIPRWAKIAAGVVAVYAALGFLLVPYILRKQLEAKLPPLLHRPVSVREVRFNPFDIALTVRGFSVREQDGANFVSFEELRVDLAFLRLLTGRIRFEEISLQKPAIDFALLKGGKLSFADLLEGQPDKQPEPKSDKPPPAISIEKLRIDDGSISVADLTRGAPVRLRIAPLALHLDNFTTEPAKDSPYSFTARMDPATTLHWEGELSINPLRSSGRIDVENVALASFAPYVADATQLKLANGLLTLRGKYRFDGTQTPLLFELQDGLAELASLQLDGPGERGPLVELTKLAARGVQFDLAKRNVALSEVALDGGHIRVRREKDAAIELQRLAQPAKPAAPVAEEKSEPFHTSLQKLSVKQLRVDFEDLVPAEGARFTFAPIDLDVGPLEWPTQAAIPLALSIGINQQGLLTVKGSAKADGTAEVDVALQKIALGWAQPYVNESSNAQIRSGVLTLDGHAKHAGEKNSFTGNLSVDGLSVFAPNAPKELVGFDRLALDKIAVATPPNDVRIERVLLRGLRARYLKLDDKTTNVDALTKGAVAAKEPPAAPAPAAAQKPSKDRYAIGSFILENSTLEYGDRSVSPAFSAKISQLGGKIVPIAWPNPAKTHLDLTAKVDAAPFALNGDVEPRGPRAADLNAILTMKGWDLIPTTGYSLKATGYPVQKGKFSLDLKYKIADRKIDGQNLVVIDQLTLGDHQDVPGATGLPVKLALAILTDRNGTLTVDLPVSGDLNDPSFSFGRMVLATVKNLLVTVATSPFSLLAGLAGGNDDLSTVSFAAGSSDLPPKEVEKLQKLGKVLIDRPALKIEIEGKIDAKADGDALRRDKVHERIAAQPDREKAIRAEWTALHKKPVDPKAMPSLDAMEAELIANEALTPDDLEELASDRADEAQEKLLDVQGLAPERVFVTAPKIDPKATGASAASMALK